MYWICLFACLTLQMKALCFFETLGATDPTTRRITLLPHRHTIIIVNQCLLQNDSPYTSSDFFPHLLILIHFRSFSIQSNHLNLGLPDFLCPSAFPRNTFLMVLSTDILTTWPAQPTVVVLNSIVVTVFSFVYITCDSSLVWILQPFWSFIRPSIFLSIYWFHLLCHYPHFIDTQQYRSNYCSTSF
jgi:hypothetical protein